MFCENLQVMHFTVILRFNVTIVIALLCLYDILFVQVLKNVLNLTFELKNTEIKMI